MSVKDPSQIIKCTIITLHFVPQTTNLEGQDSSDAEDKVLRITTVLCSPSFLCVLRQSMLHAIRVSQMIM